MAVKQVTDGTAPFSDFVYSGDNALPLQSTDAATESLAFSRQSAFTFGLQISWPKTMCKFRSRYATPLHLGGQEPCRTSGPVHLSS